MERKIPFSKPCIGKEEIRGVVEVLKSGWLSIGPKVKEFEEAFKAYIGCGESVAVSSCTAGLHLSLKALGISSGDDVLTTPFTFAATANAIVHCGAKPVFVDIEADTFNIDPNKIEEKITSRTKALVVVHYGGHPCEMDQILDICKRHKLLLIEDCAHAIGAEYKGKKIGNFGDCGVFSFYATKNITTGDGGMVVTNSAAVAEKVRLLRLHGLSHDALQRYESNGSWYYEILDAGFKYNLTDIQAALGIAQLKKLDLFNAKREKIAQRYSSRLKMIDECVQIPQTRPFSKSAWHLYPVVFKRKSGIARNDVINKLKEKGICCSVHFIPLHLHQFYQKEYSYAVGDFPVSEAVYTGIISLPLYPQLKIKDVDYVANEVRNIVEKNERS